MAALIVMAVAAPSASAAPWSCDAFGYLYQSPTQAAPPHEIFQVDLATGDYTSRPGGSEDWVNAVGYNVLDDYMYGWHYETGELVRIHDDGSFDELGLPAGIPAGSFYNVGDVDSAGHYWIMQGGFGSGQWYEIDLAPGSPTYGEVVDSGVTSAPAGIVKGSDWAWINGALYHVGHSETNQQAYLLRMDPATGVTTNLGTVGFTAAGGVNAAVGAVYADAAGYLYASDNQSGNIYRIDPATRQTILASNGPVSGQNDGARCAEAPIPTITVTKTVGGRVRPADQFTVGLLRPDGTPATSATTSGAGTTVSTVNFPASQGQTYTITDAMAAGSPTPLGEYVQSITCTDGAGNPAPVTGTGPNWSFVVAQAANYTCNVTNRPVADLRIEKSAAPSPVVPGEDVTWTLTVTNNGPSTSIGETVTDQLPAEATFSSASPGCGEAGGTVSCAVGELAPGASKTFTITARVASSLDQCLRNTATVSGGFDPDMSNNSASICTPIEGRADLSIVKTPSDTTVMAGGQVIYTLVIANDGPSDASGVTVRDPMAQGLTLVSANPAKGTCQTANNTVSCDIGDLKAGGSTQVLVTATTTAAATGNITNRATVTGNEEDPTPENNTSTTTITITPQPPGGYDLVTEKTVNNSRPRVGQKVTYTIVVRNEGPGPAVNSRMTETLDAPVRVVSVNTTQGECDRTMPITCSLGTIQAGGRVTITVVVRHLRAGSGQRNAASAVAEGTDPTPGNNIDTTTVNVRKLTLKITKVASRTSVQAGDTLSYGIRVRNPSKGQARNVKVCDRLPSGMSFVSSSPRAKRSGGQRCWTIKTLKAGQSRTFRVTVRTARGANGRKVNRAVLSSPDIRPAIARRPVRVRGVASPVTG